MRIEGLCLAACLASVSWAQAPASPDDSVLTVYWLTPAQESQFSRTDGVLSEFWGALSPASDRIVEVPPDNCYPGRCNFTGTQDATLEVRAAGGAAGLYLLLYVTDDRWVMRTSVDDWGADGLDIYLDSLDAAGIYGCTDCLLGLYDSRLTYTTQQFGTWIGGSTLDHIRYFAYDGMWCWCWTAGQMSPDEAEAQLELKVELLALDSTHQALEFFLPWARVGAKGLASVPLAGRRIAFTAGYNDKDGDSVNPDCLRWLGKDPWSGDAQYWGDLEMGEGFPVAVSIPAPKAPQTPRLVCTQYFTLTGREVAATGRGATRAVVRYEAVAGGPGRLRIVTPGR